MFGFTRQERAVILFLLFALIVGSGIALLKKRNSGFAPELIPLSSQRAEVKGKVGESSRVSFTPVHKKVNINTASPEELQSLPGIGPSLARRIIEYRSINGRFRRVEEIKKVSGIGERSFQRIKKLIAVGKPFSP